MRKYVPVPKYDGEDVLIELDLETGKEVTWEVHHSFINDNEVYYVLQRHFDNWPIDTTYFLVYAEKFMGDRFCRREEYINTLFVFNGGGEYET